MGYIEQNKEGLSLHSDIDEYERINSTSKIDYTVRLLWIIK